MKQPWKSWTLWFNLICLIYEFLVQNGVVAALPISAADQAKILLIGNMLLRVKTRQPIW